MAQEGRERLRAEQDVAAARKGQATSSNPGRPGPDQCHGRPGRAGRSCAGQRLVSDRRPGEEDGRRRHSRRDLGRPGGRPADGSPDAVSVARADLRRGSQVGELRFGLFVRLSIQPVVERADPAGRPRAEPAARLRAALRRRLSGGAPQEPGDAARAAAVDPRFRARRHHAASSASSGNATIRSSTNTWPASAKSSGESSRPNASKTSRTPPSKRPPAFPAASPTISSSCST